MTKKNKFRFYVLLFILLILSACAPITRPEQPVQTEFTLLPPGETIGQSLVANFDGLNGIVLALSPLGSKPPVQSSGELILHLRHSPSENADIASTRINVSTIDKSGFYRFSIPAQNHSTRQDYYFFIENASQNPIRFGCTSQESYLDGLASRNNRPLPGKQLTFLLGYNRIKLFAGLLHEFALWLWYLLLAAFLFIIPGLAILEWSSINPLPPVLQKESADKETTHRIDPIATLGLSLGVSLAIYPLLFLFTDLIGLHFGIYYALLPGTLAICFLLYRIFKQKRLSFFHRFKPVFSSTSIPEFVTLGIFILLVISRFWVIRNLDGPLWGDGYHHTVVVQLFIDHQGLFSSWLPFADIHSFTYHFGFHTASAVFAWLSRLPSRFAVLWTGQLLNIMAILVLYPLAVRLSKNRWAGVMTIALAGFLSPTPMFYTNWGRYTQLAGEVILPVLLVINWDYFNSSNRHSWRKILLCGVLWAGLGLTHYRIFILAIIAIIAYLIMNTPKTHIKNRIAKLIWVAVTGGVLFLPWFIRVFSGNIMHIFSAQIKTLPAGNPSLSHSISSLGPIDAFLPYWLWLIMFLGMAISLWQKNRYAATLVLWVFLSFVAANPAWLNLPGTHSLSNFAIFIGAYIPASLFGGFLFGEILQKFRRSANLSQSIVGITIFLIALAGFKLRMNDIQPAKFALLTRPDVRSSAWIRQNTPSNAKFWINSFPAFYNSRVGSDGGWWLPIIAHRNVSVRPLNIDFEQPLPPHQREIIDRLADLLQTRGMVDDPEALILLKANHFTHIYIGQQNGRVNYSGKTLDPDLFLKSSSYALVYHQDAVWVFAINP